MIKAVIYDFDDIIVDSDSLHVESWEEALKKYKVSSFENFRKWRAENLMGKKSLENAYSIVAHYKINADPNILYQKKTKIFMTLIKKRLKLLPGVEKSLKLFKKQKLRMAIATGSHRKYIEMILNKFKLSKYFYVYVTAEDISHGKPDPQTYLVACQKLGYAPSECIVIEDATAGVQSAKAAGCKCIAIPNKNVTTQDYSKADLNLDSLEKITKNTISNL